MFSRLMILALVPLLLWGCSADPLAREQRAAGAPLDIIATVTTPIGPVQLYRYTKGDECGYGYVALTDGGSARGGRTCTPQLPIGLQLIQHDGAPGQPFALLFGSLQDERITQVTVEWGAGNQVRAAVDGDAWYLVLPGANDLSDLAVIGLDAAGQEVARMTNDQFPGP